MDILSNNTTDDLWSQVNLKKEKIQETQNKINSIQKKQTLTKSNSLDNSINILESPNQSPKSSIYETKKKKEKL